MLDRRTKTTLVATILAALVAASAAQAKVTDPRKCSLQGTNRQADCAQAAATSVARRVLQRKVNQSYPWQAPLTCTHIRTLLRWRCSFETGRTDVLPARGYVAVTYRATSTGWHVYTAIVATP